jgi:putative membrane protein
MSTLRALRATRQAAAGAVGLAALLAMAGGAAAAAAPGPVTDQETVQINLKPSGALSSARLYTQLSASGGGSVQVTDPVSAENLRTLSGFGGPTVVAGTGAKFSLKGGSDTPVRVVSDFKRQLPVTVRTTYLLDGKEVQPASLVGKSGKLEVRYHVENATGKSMDVAYKNSAGETVTEKSNVVLPLVAQLTTSIPGELTGLAAPQAQAGGDGQGNTRLLWSMVLFAPIGAEQQDVGWSAQLDGSAVPGATMQVAPVAPKDNPVFSSAQQSLKQGADSGAQLVSGAKFLNSSLGKLRDGAGQLLAGLNQLADGADQLAGGIDQAADGSAKFAAGFSSTGKSLTTGSRDLSEGLSQLSDGLGQLSTSEGLPRTYTAALGLKAGVDQIAAGLGSASDPKSVLGGLAQLKAGNKQAADGADELNGGLKSVSDGIGQAQGGIDQVAAGIADSAKAGGSIDQLAGGIAAARATAGCSGDPVCAGTLTQIQAGVVQSKSGAQQSAGALAAISAGLGQAIGGIGTTGDPQSIRGGLAALSGGLSQSVTGMGQLSAGVREIKSGLSTGSTKNPGIAEGLGLLAEGLQQAVTGIGQLADGASAAADGSGQLADGISQAGSGAQQLTSGLGQLADGGRQLSTGAGKLADGLGQIENGIGQFQDQGVGAIAGSVGKPADEYAKKYATLNAMNTRVAQDGMPYGAPEGATGDAVFNYRLAGVNQNTQHNAIRGGIAVLLLAAAAGGGLVLRRRSLDASVGGGA